MASDAVEGSRRRIQDNVLVAVRVRPCSDDAIVSVTGNDLSLATPRSNLGGGGGGARSHSFAFDRCYLDATQADIFADLGESVLRNAFDGFNSTVLAYGQTGSGKSYCMMGTPDSPGLIPNIASALFDRIDQVGGDDRRRTFHCEASYLEIYNERVRDLLAPARAEGAGLTVREHPVHGPYVEDLSVIPVQSFDDVQRLITQGNSARTVAATRMNAESSRSHAICTCLTMTLKQALSDRTSGATSEKVARMHLVDLAGSERQVKTKAKGAHLKEASEINKSLVTLGRVISALADASSAPRRPSASSPRAAHPHIPFRDSTLTWLLKGSFGLSGNARTALLCTISARPSDYEETLGALRYAARAKKIVTTAVCNEDSDVKVVECLKQEIADLTERLNHAERWSAQEIATLTTELEQSQKLIDTVNMSWGEKLAKAESIRQRREQALISEGIAVKMDPALPFLCNLAEDPAVSECLVYYLRQGETRVGRSRDLAAPCIVLHDEHVPDLLCVFTNINGAVQVKPWDGARGVHVNGQTVERAVALAHGDRVILGRRLSFRFSASIQSIERKSMQRSQAKIDYEFAQAELNARLSSVIEDLERERQQVRLLQERVQSTGAEYSTAVAQLETERLAKLELSRQLQFAREQNSVHERSLESTKSLSASQQRELRAVHQELQLEKAMRMDLSRTIDAMSQSVQSPTTTCAAARADVDEWVGRVLRRAIMRRRRESSTTLGELLASVDQANAMAHALSHEVLFDVGCTWQAVGITVDADHPFVAGNAC
ncbi:hypothetical protein PBRA_008163 [Plasmodiophora brassicae]|uniref:Kinesin-like protein n=1 Tax=Plasmodiophora brassicae TaxID=37360 RepID=A0A0G4J0M3_PLABS|nr:hypothetical protein PBRA_008163 [Plasmodiophora brassicae]